MDYIAIIHKEPDSAYGVGFPDFPGCITAADTLDEAKDNAAEVLAMHIAGMVEDGDGIPNPSTLDKVMADPDFQDGVAFLVPVQDRREKAVRVQLTFLPSVLATIDAKATASQLTRSAFLATAALKADTQP